MSRLLRSAALTALLTAAVLSPPSAGQAQSIFDACKSAIAKHCAEVEPGHGRLMACLYANEEKLSKDCDAATVDVSDMLDRFFELVRYTQQECRVDIAKHCENVEFGHGRIFHCLKQRSAELTPDCAASVATIQLPQD
ncbi:MAG: hypothetical protein Kilf2KO_12880 [Rhodospirillales bacterium]